MRRPSASFWRHAAIAVILCLGIGLSAGIFSLVRHREQRELRRHFTAAARDRVSAIQAELDAHKLFLESIASLYAASDEVNRHEFHTFTAPLLARYPDILALAWAPRVSASERATYEQSARREGLESIPIAQRTPEGRMVPDVQREEYFPVHFAESLRRSASTLGFNLASEPHTLAALSRARDTGEACATEPVALGRQTRDRLGFLIFMPVYSHGATLETVQQRREHLQGFVVGTYRIKNVVEASLGRLVPAGVSFDVEESGDSGSRLLYYHQSRAEAGRLGAADSRKAGALAGLSYRAAVSLPGRQWWVTCSVVPTFISDHATFYPWYVLIIGLAFTLVVGWYLFSATRNAEKQSRLAGDLAANNEALQSEMAGRRNAEASLLKTNAELKTALAGLAQANNELKEFVYIASHDLREPLRKISSFGSLLKESLDGNLNEDDRENLMFMVDGADRMTQMIEGLLTYSRVNTSEKMQETIDLNKVVRDLESLELGAAIEESGTIIEVPEPLPCVAGNPAQVSQLLQNLIANGIKYARDGVAPQVLITADDDGDAVRVSVRDNGIGIPQEHYENIFKMFRRLHSRRKYTGTGIGLAVCKRIVDKHNGQIGVESEEGEGTTFWFTLPRAERAVTPAAEAVALV